MDDAVALEGEHEEHTSTGLPTQKIAMWIFLSSECLLFGALITTYLLYRGRSTVGPYPNDVFDIPFTSVSSFILLGSSLTMVLALSALQHGDLRRFRIWTLTTALMGAAFIGGQVYEFTTFAKEGLHLDTNLFGSTFFTLTGFHGVHVTLGILMLLSLVGLTYSKKVTEQHTLSVELVGLYWHFVDVVWIIIFTLVYLIPDPSGGR